MTVVLPGVLVLATGLAVTVAPLTATAMGAAPAEHSGIASAVNNVVARTAGLFAVALLPLLAGITGAAALAPSELAAGFRTAMVYRGSGSRLPEAWWPRSRSATLPAPGHRPGTPSRAWHCAVGAPPLRAVPTMTSGEDQSG